jgi:hypothetical protein
LQTTRQGPAGAPSHTHTPENIFNSGDGPLEKMAIEKKQLIGGL